MKISFSLRGHTFYTDTEKLGFDDKPSEKQLRIINYAIKNMVGDATASVPRDMNEAFISLARLKIASLEA